MKRPAVVSALLRTAFETGTVAPELAARASLEDLAEVEQVLRWELELSAARVARSVRECAAAISEWLDDTP